MHSMLSTLDAPRRLLVFPPPLLGVCLWCGALMLLLGVSETAVLWCRVTKTIVIAHQNDALLPGAVVADVPSFGL